MLVSSKSINVDYSGSTRVQSPESLTIQALTHSQLQHEYGKYKEYHKSLVRRGSIYLYIYLIVDFMAHLFTI
jgi:hypothetical protein